MDGASKFLTIAHQHQRCRIQRLAVYHISFRFCSSRQSFKIIQRLLRTDENRHHKDQVKSTDLRSRFHAAPSSVIHLAINCRCAHGPLHDSSPLSTLQMTHSRVNHVPLTDQGSPQNLANSADEMLLDLHAVKGRQSVLRSPLYCSGNYMSPSSVSRSFPQLFATPLASCNCERDGKPWRLRRNIWSTGMACGPAMLDAPLTQSF
jgi:hypothetical protein